jgi:hypothetical protein
VQATIVTSARNQTSPPNRAHHHSWVPAKRKAQSHAAVCGDAPARSHVTKQRPTATAQEGRKNQLIDAAEQRDPRHEQHGRERSFDHVVSAVIRQRIDPIARQRYRDLPVDERLGE